MPLSACAYAAIYVIRRWQNSKTLSPSNGSFVEIMTDTNEKNISFFLDTSEKNTSFFIDVEIKRGKK